VSEPVAIQKIHASMDEAKKTNRLRTEDFKRRYFSGRVIDIGCGPDLVEPHAEPFDVEHGDAQCIRKYFSPGIFDCVHSSHCLEHMRDVGAALEQWWGLVKPGGYLVIVVPHEDLYEQGAWPSLFNSDHKATFNLGRRNGLSPISYDIGALVRDLANAEIIEACIHDHGLDYRLIRRGVTRWGRFMFGIAQRRRRYFGWLMRRGIPLYRLDLAIDKCECLLGKPIDQTLGPALAQIQVVARKAYKPSPLTPREAS
jgi:SAM-dependent methyltransferase